MILEPLPKNSFLYSLRHEISPFEPQSLNLPISDFVQCAVNVVLRDSIDNIIRNLTRPIRHKLYELREEGH
jgi:hypothetical protein